MHARNRVEARAQAIFTYLRNHLGQRFTIDQLCRAVDIHDGATTRSALRRARDLATEAGLHFPPAVPHTGFTYMVTTLPGDALDPALHMARIERGIRLRKENGEAFMRRRLKDVDPADRPAAAAFLKLEQLTRKSLAEVRSAADEAIAELVRMRRR